MHRIAWMCACKSPSFTVSQALNIHTNIYCVLNIPRIKKPLCVVLHENMIYAGWLKSKFKHSPWRYVVGWVESGCNLHRQKTKRSIHDILSIHPWIHPLILFFYFLSSNRWPWETFLLLPTMNDSSLSLLFCVLALAFSTFDSQGRNSSLANKALILILQGKLWSFYQKHLSSHSLSFKGGREGELINPAIFWNWADSDKGKEEKN